MISFFPRFGCRSPQVNAMPNPRFGAPEPRRVLDVAIISTSYWRRRGRAIFMIRDTGFHPSPTIRMFMLPRWRPRAAYTASKARRRERAIHSRASAWGESKARGVFRDGTCGDDIRERAIHSRRARWGGARGRGGASAVPPRSSKPSGRLRSRLWAGDRLGARSPPRVPPGGISASFSTSSPVHHVDAPRRGGRDLVELLLVEAGRDDRGQPGPVRREQLLLQAADGQHVSPERELAGHGQGATDGPLGQDGEHGGGDGDPGRGPVLGDGALRHVHVQVVAGEVSSLLRTGVPARGVGESAWATPHHVAQGSGQVAALALMAVASMTWCPRRWPSRPGPWRCPPCPS